MVSTQTIFIIGIFAVIMTSLRLMPQIVKSYKTRKVRDVSLLWEVIGLASSLLWLVYGYLRADYILAAAGVVLTISYTTLIYQKFHYSK